MALTTNNTCPYICNDDTRDATIVIPTMGRPDLIVSCIDAILRHREDLQLRIVIPCNPKVEDADMALASKAAAEQIVAIHNGPTAENGVKYEPPVDLVWIDMGAPAGWSGAVNAGLLGSGGLAKAVVVMNDDALATEGWLHKMIAAFDSPSIWSFDQFHQKPEYANGSGDPIEEYGKLGMVGPCSNIVAGTQKVIPPEINTSASTLFERSGDSLLSEFALQYGSKCIGRITDTDFLSGFCITYSRDCLFDLLVDDGDTGWLLDPVFNVGGYDDNDVSIRSWDLGWKKGVVRDAYVHHKGHQTLDQNFPEQRRGMANSSVYINKWHTTQRAEKRLIALSRTKLFRLDDLHMFRAACTKQAEVSDGLCILFTGNPADVLEADDFNPNAIDPDDLKFLEACKGASKKKLIKVATKRITEWSCKYAHNVDVKVDLWEGEFNERNERNRSIEIAEAMDADWLLSFDHDEVIEDRVDRKMFRRMLHHPNPMVNMYDFGWLNHWGSTDFHRVDSPWSHGYESSMRGFRLWRVQKNAEVPNRIPQSGGVRAHGLHCGNVPRYGHEGKRVAGVRFRHLGYVNHRTRQRKHAFYTDIDPDPDLAMVGPNGYDHLVNQENMRLSQYHPVNGIAFTMLIYKEEQITGLYQWLDGIYTLADRVCLVWTGPEGTKPSKAMEKMCKSYDVEWVYHPYDDDLAACRNAGIEYLRQTKKPGTRWFFTMDDDESFEDTHRGFVAIRRMAEVTDSWGWMFRFRNWRADGNFNYSESVRLALLDPKGIMKFHGRVHETVEKSLKELQSNGVHPQIKYFFGVVDHYGLAGSEEEMQVKLEKYALLLEKEIMDDPTSVGAWVSLALQYANDGAMNEHHLCLEHATRMATSEFLPFKELGNFHLRQASACFRRAQDRLVQSHEYYPVLVQINDFLDQMAAPIPVSGSALSGAPKELGVDLGALLTRADEAFEKRRLEQEEHENLVTAGVDGEPISVAKNTTPDPKIAKQPPQAGA